MWLSKGLQTANQRGADSLKSKLTFKIVNCPLQVNNKTVKLTALLYTVSNGLEIRHQLSNLGTVDTICISDMLRHAKCYLQLHVNSETLETTDQNRQPSKHKASARSADHVYIASVGPGPYLYVCTTCKSGSVWMSDSNPSWNVDMQLN